MTKMVRIENADTTSYKVEVEVWDKGVNGGPDTLAQTFPLDYPTMEVAPYITSTRYLVVKEKPA